ncbi:general transcription factor 3C polypeptide 5 [Belonocnema kinseyi]|uniref:general transcription factor 3C polypeptide 5 n=1 Tax=Belonocnema kinseyi TaxID=2817044 RepID=UPI00143CF486|nr:general transcription factor 3C polypeptide 5 [Belonocnema kinseyi]
MSETNESIDRESDNEERNNGNYYKDKDFNIEDYQDEIESDESFDFEETNKNRPGPSNTTPQESKRPYLRVIESAKEFKGPVLPGGHRFDRKLTCIKYPGNVINQEKAIETLGGLTSISTAVDANNRRLELRFRPDDGYSKPACGDKHTTCGFLLRVRVKKSRVEQANREEARKNRMPRGEVRKTELMTENTDNSEENDKTGESMNPTQNILPTFDKQKYENLSQDKDYDLPKLKVLGRVDIEFRFTNLCDFQYLPIMKNPQTKKEECIYDNIYPVGIPPYRWLGEDVPYFLPPAAFSRMASIQQYVPKTVLDMEPDNIIGKTRKRRAGFSNFVSFNAPEIPSKPPKGIETAMKVKFLQNFHLDRIAKLFDERPIWSKNALIFITNFTSEQLKILLPSVAYYFLTGPWRVMWVRLGYDPRKDPTARKYQTLDYRLKAMHGLGSTVKCKRNYSEYNLPYKSAPVSKPKSMILTANYNLETQKKKRNLSENVYIYREGFIPPSRQMFYQYCDILVDEIQEMLSKLPDPLPGTKCDLKLGWLPNGFDAQCREIINRQIRAELRKQNNIPEDHPTSLPRKKKFINRKLIPDKKRPRQRKKDSDVADTGDDSEPESIGSLDAEDVPLGDRLVVIGENDSERTSMTAGELEISENDGGTLY